VKGRALAVGGIALALVALWWLVLRETKARFTHHGEPAFSVLYKAKVVHRRPGPGLASFSVARGGMRGSLVVVRYALPDYTGDLAGAVPIVAEHRARDLARRYDGFRLTADNRARLHDAPGYELGFSFRTTTGVGEGTDLILVPPDVAHPRDGVLVSYRLTKPAGPQPLRIRRAAQALRSAFRSFEFGTDRF
jgi:hypothetical protein